MLRIRSRSAESVQQMISRFKKLCEKEGLIRDMKRNSYYEKPSEKNRRRIRKAQKVGDFVALAPVEGRIRIASLSYDVKYDFQDKFNNIHNIVYVGPTEMRAMENAIVELEELINSPSAKEQDFHSFFERNPQFIISYDYKAAHSKIVLYRDNRAAMIPDFVLEPLGQNELCDLLELKRPDARILVSNNRQMWLSSALMKACSQLREYSAYFEEEHHRQRIQSKYGLHIYRPRMIVIIGRKGSVSPIEFRRLEEDVPKLRIKTYDDMILRGNEILRRMIKGGI